MGNDGVMETLLDCEMFYYVGHRLNEVVENEFGLPGKKPNVVRIRNHHIEHPDRFGSSRAGAVVGGPEGPKLFFPSLPEERAELAKRKLLDEGLWVNALDLATRLSSRIRAKLAASPPGTPQTRLPAIRKPRLGKQRRKA